MIPMSSKPTYSKLIPLLFGCFVLLGGCTFRVADLTLVSTKNVDLNNTSLDARKGKRVKGEHCAFALLGLIPFGVPNLEEAVDEALEKGKGNIMVDQVTYSTGAYYILLSQSFIEVEGTVLNIAEHSG